MSGQLNWPLAVAVVLCCACSDPEELRAAQANADRELAEKAELYDDLGARRFELEQLEADFASLEAAAADAGVELPAAVTPAPPPPIPPPSIFEGASAARRRMQLEDTRRRIRELDTAHGDLSTLPVRRRQLADALEVMKPGARAACERGAAEGCWQLGLWNQLVERTPAARTRAAPLFRGACDAGYARACSSLAYLDQSAPGGAATPADDLALYEQACKLGDAPGCTISVWLKTMPAR